MKVNLKDKFKKRQLTPFGKKVILTISLIGFGLFGVWVLSTSMASTPSTGTTRTTQCGRRVQNYTYRVPFGDAVWNQPVCNLPKHPQSTDYANRFFTYSNLNSGSAADQALRGNLRIGFGYEPLPVNFSRNVYFAKDATTQVKIQAALFESNLDGIKFDDGRTPDAARFKPNASIPWNPAWETGQGGDNEIVILDEATGRIYEIFGYKKDLAAVLQCGPFERERLCTYTVQIGRDLNGGIVDYRTFNGPLPQRGVGLSSYATLVTPEEVAAGEIRHAIGVAVPNTAVGPVCTKAQLGTAAEGKTCGTAVAPATKFEWADLTQPRFMPEPYRSLYTQEKLIPEGMRFALNIDDAYIENWINSRPDLKSNPRKAETARIFARAMRDYGIMIVDTNGARAEIQVAGAVNPAARQKWSSLGMQSSEDNDLLRGLINANNIYTVDTPTVTCRDGTTSRHYCLWTRATYPVQVASTNNQSSTGTSTSPAPGSTTPLPVTNLPSITASPSPQPQNPSTVQNQSTQPTVVTPTRVSIPNTVPVEIRFNWERFEFHQSTILRWGESSSPNGIARYIVNKNGRKVYEGTNREFVDFAVLSGQRYRYDIYAVDKAGNISTPATYDRTFTCSWWGLVCTY